MRPPAPARGGRRWGAIAALALAFGHAAEPVLADDGTESDTARTTTTASDGAATPAVAIDPPLGDRSTPPMPAPSADEDSPESTTRPGVPDGAMRAAIRLSCAGRHGGALLLGDGRWAVAPASLVEVGWPAELEAIDGSTSRGYRTVVRGSLALLEVDPPLPAPGALEPVDSPALADPVLVVGQGGSAPVRGALDGSAVLAAWSVLSARVASGQVEAEEGGAPWPSFLVDRVVAAEDVGGLVVAGDGRWLGLVVERLVGAERTRIVGPEAVLALLAEPRPDRPLARAHHLALWGGALVSGNGEPWRIGVGLTLGARAVLVDVVRIEPWLALRAVRRGPFGEGPEARPTEDGWELSGGASAGVRLPVFGSGRRAYLVPSIGFEAGVSVFSHAVQAVSYECPSAGNCGAVLESGRDSVRRSHAGIDLGADLQRGPMRLGYRFFLDPRAPKAGAVHRLLWTVDGFPFPIEVGPAH